MAEPDPVRGYGMGAGIDVNLQTEKAQAAVSAMSAAMKDLERSLKEFGNNASTMAEKINRHLKSIGDTATKVAGQLGQVTAAVAGTGGGQGGTPPPNAPSGNQPGASPGSSGGGWLSNATSTASAAIARVQNKSLVGGLSLGTFVGNSDDFAKDLILAPLRFLRSRITTNRETALMASGGLNMVGMQQGSVGNEAFGGSSTADMMRQMAGFPGGIMGSPDELIGMMGAAPSLGASYGFGGTPNQPNTRGQGVHASGFFRGLREMQTMNPMAPVSELTGQLGGYAGNTGAQQRSMMLTGGAMGMIAAGGRQKSLSEWAESILRWFEGLRPGNKRNKGFTYGELMAQYFPGSNIDAWFNTTGVPQNMRDYWWTYALSKTTKVADTGAAGFQIGAEEANVAWNRLKASSELTRTEFSLAGQMSGQYANREQANRWFNELLGSIQQDLFPKLAKGPFAWLQMIPDSVEDLLMTGAERGMSELLGGGDVPDVGVYGSAGDVGDIGYGELGGTGLSGLHPDMRSKLAKMMKSNPRIRVTSGLRDTGLQQRLKRKGYTRVSGKPSDHTRGMAADLGPPSQYNWISANAGKFGLTSGKGFGEPWHVGMRGVIGDAPGVGDAFSDFLDAIKDFGSEPEDMASFITKILGTMVGAIGRLFGGEVGTTDVKPGAGTAGGGFQPDFYERLLGASKKVQIGIPVSNPFEGGGGGDGGPVGSVTPGLGGFQSPDKMARAIATAKAAHAAGFSGEDLVKIVAIAGRESTWTPTADNPNTSDAGLFQVNWSAWGSTATGMGYSEADMFDPTINSKMAKAIYDSQGWPAWGMGSNGSWAAGGDPLGFTDRPWNGGSGSSVGISKAREAVESAGLGDIGDVERDLALSQTSTLASFKSGGRVVAFNNTFVINAPMGGSGGGIGIDARRTATVLADHLEQEMKTRLARAS